MVIGALVQMVYSGFDSCRRGRRAVRIDFQSTALRSDGHVRIAVSVRDRVPAGEREKSGDAPDRNSVAACRPRGGVGASRIHGSVGAGLYNREAMKMVSSVPVLLLGIAIISTVGSIFGYLLEPGTFREARRRRTGSQLVWRGGPNANRRSFASPGCVVQAFERPNANFRIRSLVLNGRSLTAPALAGWLWQPLAGVGADFFLRPHRARKKKLVERKRLCTTTTPNPQRSKPDGPPCFRADAMPRPSEGSLRAAGFPSMRERLRRRSNQSVPTDRLGTVSLCFVGVALVAGGALTIAQIWTNLAMIR